VSPVKFQVSVLSPVSSLQSPRVCLTLASGHGPSPEHSLRQSEGEATGRDSVNFMPVSYKSLLKQFYLQ